MRPRSLARRAPGLVAALLCAAAALPATAAAQSDATFGCRYAVTADHAGPVGHANIVQVTIRDCAYAWDTFQVRLRDAASSTYTEAPAGFACDDAGFDLVCGRPAPSTAGADLGFRPQCPNSGRLRLTVRITDTAGGVHSGELKSLPCARPPITVLSPPARQSLATALKSGVVTRFSCAMRCSARVTLIADTAKGETVGARTFRRTRTGPFRGRVRVTPAWRSRWRRKNAAFVTVSVTLRASTGEMVSLGHTVRLRY